MSVDDDIKYEGTQGDLKVTLRSHFKGLAWRFENKKGEDLSVICHGGSYGKSDGLFEIMPSWANDVTGYLKFGDVQRWINKLEKRGDRK